MAMAEVHDPLEYALTLVGNNLVTDRRTVFRGIPVDPRGINGERLTMRELCTMAPFQVYGVEFETPCPGRDPPAPASKAPDLISLVDSDDEAAGVRPPSAPAAAPPSAPAAAPPSPPVFGLPSKGRPVYAGQVYAAKARLVSRSPSPQVCTFSSSLPPLSSPYAMSVQAAGAVRHASPLWPAQARTLGSSHGPYLRMSASPDLHAPGWPPRVASRAASPLPLFANQARLYGSMSPVTPRASSPLLPSRMLARSPPRSPEYSVTSSVHLASRNLATDGFARSPPPLRRPTPSHVCDANCGFEGTEDEVLVHEKKCLAWRVWKQIKLAKRRDTDRKRKERQQETCYKHEQARLLAARLVDPQYLAYLAANPAGTASASTADDKCYDLQCAASSSEPASSKPRKRQKKRADAAAQELLEQCRAADAAEVQAQELAARERLEEGRAAEVQAAIDAHLAKQKKQLERLEEGRAADAAEVQAAIDAHLAKQKQLFLERTQADALGFAKQLEDNVPEFWTAASGERAEVPRGSDEFKKIEAQFEQQLGVDAHAWPHADYTVEKLYRIVNRDHWTAFEMRRMQTSKLQDTPEQTFIPHPFPNDTKLLWHGTGAGSAAAIMKYGFNRSAGANGQHGAVLGRGTYFSPLPRLCLSGEKGCLSHVYTPVDSDGFKHLLLCNVLLGNSILGKSMYHSFPPAVHSTVDSLLDVNKLCVQHDSSINVLYEVVVSYKR